MQTRRRRLGIALAALAAGGLAWFAPPPEADNIALPAKRTEGAHKAALTRAARLDALPQRPAIGELRTQLFTSKSWAPPPTAPSAAAAAASQAAPVAPANPYKVAGTLIQDGAKRVFLINADRVYEVKPGDELDGGYKVESIAADRIVLVYVPLGTKSELAITSTLAVDAPVAAPPATPQAAGAPAAAAISASSAGATSAAEGMAKPAQLRWDGPERVHAGTSFNVSLRVSSDEPLRATPMQLRFEPQFLEPVNVRAGKFFGQGSFSYRVNAEGSIFVGATAQGSAPGADAELLVVTFRPIKAGATAVVKVSSLALQGPAGRALAHGEISAFKTLIQ